MRWGKDANEDGRIDSWQMISAEEVTAEVVRAAASRDAPRFSRLLITAAEIDSLGVGKAKGELLKQRSTDAAKQFSAWAAGQSVVTSESTWTNFGADKPGIIPAGTEGSDRDVIVYESVVAILDSAGQSRQLLVGTMVKVGENWRIVDLPKAVTEGAELASAGVFMPATFSSRDSEAAPTNVPGGISKAMERLVNELTLVDNKLVARDGDIALLHAKRADVLEKLISESKTAEERGGWIRQFADTVGAAAQSGEYPAGVTRLRRFTSKLSSVKATADDIAYVVFRTLTAEHNVQMMQPKADYEKLQKAYIDTLEAFAKKYPRSPDSADAMIQIALSAEFSGNVPSARQWYTKASRGFPSTLHGQKATGALKRLDLEGQRFGLKATTIDGREFSSAGVIGAPVVYHCWANWCEGCKAEMRALKELRSKYAKQKLRVVGINFDSESDQAKRDAIIAQGGYDWPHLSETKGLDGSLAVGYGILTLPMNIVVDKDGKVIKTGVHWTELDSLLEGMVK